jgi:hypothetical protein
MGGVMMNDYMRRRQREAGKDSYNNSEMATVTSSGKEIAAQGVGEYRDIPLVAPFGIRWNPPVGANVELIKNWSMGKAVVAVGTIVDQEISPGECQIYSIGGATVTCKLDGSMESKAAAGNTIKLMRDGTVEISNQGGNASIILDSSGNITVTGKTITHIQTG